MSPGDAFGSHGTLTSSEWRPRVQASYDAQDSPSFTHMCQGVVLSTVLNAEAANQTHQFLPGFTAGELCGLGHILQLLESRTRSCGGYKELLQRMMEMKEVRKDQWSPAPTQGLAEVCALQIFMRKSD